MPDCSTVTFETWGTFEHYLIKAISYYKSLVIQSKHYVVKEKAKDLSSFWVYQESKAQGRRNEHYFTEEVDLEDHFKLNCPQCSQKFKNQQGLSLHMICKHERLVFPYLLVQPFFILFQLSSNFTSTLKLLSSWNKKKD